MFRLFKRKKENRFGKKFDKNLKDQRSLRLIMNSVTMNAHKKMEDSLKWRQN